MRRIKAACLEQTVHFMLKEDIDPDSAARLVKEELEHYKSLLEHNHTKYKIIEEADQPDGSIIIKIKKQYNYCDLGDYLN